jgi:hypothetical protein
MGFSRDTQRFCRDHVVMPHAPFGVMGGRRLADPAVFPFGSMSPSKVFAPASERFADSHRRDALWIFFKDAHEASFAAEAPVEMNLFRSLQIPQIDRANPAKNCGKCSLF